MFAQIQNRRQELIDLCRHYRVKRLEVFGSAATDDFEPGRSDLDFLVQFQPPEEDRIAPDYFGLLHALEDLFHTDIDLVMDVAIRNPYFRDAVDRSRVLLYAA
jgi:predicted nucleotidyltransferase